MDSGYACPQKMAAPCYRDVEPRAAINSPLATREPSGTPISLGFPKTARILKAADFRKVYNEGTRFTGRYFAAFCLRVDRAAPADYGLPSDFGAPANLGAQTAKLRRHARLGFTVPRAFGKAILRNRVKRRLREALRVRLPKVGPEWDIVINPRRPAIAAPVEDLQREVDRLVAQCRKQ